MNGKNAWIPLLLLMPLSIGNVYVARRHVGNALFARWQFGGVAGDSRLCKNGPRWPDGLTTWANRPDLRDTVPVTDLFPDRPARPEVVIVPIPRPHSGGNLTRGIELEPLEPISPPWRLLEPDKTEFTVATGIRPAPVDTVPVPPPGPGPDPGVSDSSRGLSAFALLPLASLAGAASPTRANVTVAVVPEPGTLALLSTGIALLIPLGMIRRRRARRADSGAAERAD